MSETAPSWRPAPLLPAGDGLGAGLALGALIIGLVASLALAWLGADLRAGQALGARLGGEATVAVAAAPGPEPLESSTAAAWRAAESLSALPGVASARVMTPQPDDRALAQTLGIGAPANDPGRLIAVRLKTGHSGVPSAQWLQRLRAEGLRAGVDDHSLGSGPVERGLWLSTLRLIGLCAVSLIAAAALGALGADRLIGRHALRLRLLGGFGMTDLDGLRLVLTPILIAAAVASGLAAAGGALLAAAGDVRPPGLSAFVGRPQGTDLWVILFWPPLSVLASLGVAAVMSRRQLRRLIP